MPMNHVIVTLNKRTPSTNDACARKLGLQRAPCSPQLLCVQEVNHCAIISFVLLCIVYLIVYLSVPHIVYLVVYLFIPWRFALSTWLALYCLPDCLPECITYCLPDCLRGYSVEVRIVYLIGFVLST